MRVGIAAQRFFSPHPSTSTRAAIALVRAVSRRASDHTFVLFARPGPNMPDDLPGNVEIEPFDAPTVSLWEQVALPWIIRDARVDLLHCMDGVAPLTVDIPHVLSVPPWLRPSAGSFDRTNPPHSAPPEDRRTVNLRTASLRRAAAVLTHSPRQALRLTADSQLPSEMVYTIPHVVADRFYPMPRVEARACLASRYDLPRLFSLLPASLPGFELPDDALRYGLKAQVRYARRAMHTGTAVAPMVIPGMSPARLHRLLGPRDVAREREHVLLPGSMDEDHLPALYSESTLLLAPWIERGSPALLEAMACGTPVVTTERGAGVETAGSAAALVDARDPATGAREMYRLIHDGTRPLRLGIEGIRHARAYAWQRAADALLEVYENVASASRVDRTPSSPPHSTTRW